MSNRRPFGHTLAARGSSHYRVLFLAALTLFSLTFVLNTVAEIIRGQKETDAANAKFLADIGAENDARLEEKYSKAWERLEGEKRIQTNEWEEERALRKRAALGLMVAGQLSEAMGKAQTAGFKAAFLRQAGVQMQVVALELTGGTYANPALATAQGFLIGL